MLGDILGGFIVILVGVNLLPTVANQVTAAQTGNVTGAASTITGLITLFFALANLSVAIGVTANALRRAGLI